MRLLPRRLWLPCRAALVVAAFVLTACGSAEPSATRSPGRLDDPSASVAATPRSALPELEFRLRDATTRHGTLIRALGDASAGSPADMRLVVGQMRDWIEGERTWLAENPAELCFRQASDRFVEAVDAMAAAADAFEAGTAPSEPASPSPSARPSADAGASPIIHPGVQALQDASRALLDAEALARTARRDCL